MLLFKGRDLSDTYVVFIEKSFGGRNGTKAYKSIERVA